MNPQPKSNKYRNSRLTQSAQHEACVSCGADDGKVKIGDRYTRLLVVGLIPDRKNPKAICICDCGLTITPQRGALKNGKAKSCGCLRRELLSAHVAKIKGNGLSEQEVKRRAKECRKKWVEKNREKVREIFKRFYEKNKERLVVYRKLSSEKKSKYDKYYRLINREKLRPMRKLNKHIRRLRIVSQSGKISKDIEVKLMASQRGKCTVCHGKLSKLKHHIDHINPLAFGGTHDDFNFQLLCPSCNRSKGAKDNIKFMQERGFLL